MLTAEFFRLDQLDSIRVVRLQTDDGTNRLTRACVLALTATFNDLERNAKPVIITGNERFFSAGADLREITHLTGPEAFEFARAGQTLMDTVDRYPAPVYAAISGYCMGGGLDLALACHGRIASPNAVLAHRGAALGLITGWGGTQRLPRLVGKAKALEIFVAAEKLDAAHALRYGLIDIVADDAVGEAARQIRVLINCRNTKAQFAPFGSTVIP